MIIVAHSKIIDENTKTARTCKYSDVPLDVNKWACDLNYMPIPYDLMHVKVKDSPRIKSAWWNGSQWQGLRLKEDDQVIAWKRNQDFE